MEYSQMYQRWLNQSRDEPELWAELNAIADDEDEIQDRFYRELEFGTGGLRGVLGAGSNRMNVYTVRKATQGYSQYLKKNFVNPSVAIGYDSRRNSEWFAHSAAEVFAANGIAVYLYEKLMPTPALSFAIRDLGCSGGIVITASHNPAKYNGYKVYGADGCQITTHAAKDIQGEIDRVDVFDQVKTAPFGTLLKEDAIHWIGEDTVERYLAAIGRASVLKEPVDRDIAIVYTPLNGAGISCVPKCLQAHGFTNITIPDEQKNPDGNFPTCPYPNPEEKAALEVGLAWAEKVGSDLLLATDPDCDRVGVAVKYLGEYHLISGNEMGLLLFNFICKQRIQNGTMPRNPVAVKTIVTSPMAQAIADHYNVELRNVLTGFKYIGEQIGLLEADGQTDRYIFGFEESYGYLTGSFVRDKDAVNASLMICELFAYYRTKGKTLIEILEELYREYGWYQSALYTYTFEGVQGLRKMQDLMCRLREKAPEEIAGIPVRAVADYQSGIRQEGTKQQVISLPKSNVLHYFLEGNLEVVVRPSGTEPKLKVYITVVADSRELGQQLLEQISAAFRYRIQNNT